MSLGKGLNALITSTGPRKKNDFNGVSGSAPAKVWSVPVSEIKPNPNQPRKQFKPDELNELAASIKEHGVLQPLLVAEKPDGGYELIAGERRWRASQLAGLAIVPVIVKELAEEQKLEIALIENIQRQDLNPIEEAFAYKRLMEEFGLTQQLVADKVGKSRPAIANAVRLLELAAPVQEALIAGKINTGQARALLGISDRTAQLDMLASMLGEKITVRELEQEVRVHKGTAVRKNPNTTYLEEKLREKLGTKVSIDQKGLGGTISITYHDEQALQDLVEKLME